jgi:hypothetical protein
MDAHAVVITIANMAHFVLKMMIAEVVLRGALARFHVHYLVVNLHPSMFVVRDLVPRIFRATFFDRTVRTRNRWWILNLTKMALVITCVLLDMYLSLVGNERIHFVATFGTAFETMLTRVLDFIVEEQSASRAISYHIALRSCLEYALLDP